MSDQTDTQTFRTYVLLRRVDYEGSSLLGAFTSLEGVFSHLRTLDGYLMDEFRVDEAEVSELDEWSIDNVAGCTQGISIDGPSDLSFEIYTVETNI